MTNGLDLEFQHFPLLAGARYFQYVFRPVLSPDEEILVSLAGKFLTDPSVVPHFKLKGLGLLVGEARPTGIHRLHLDAPH
jgi:hypothetical protein